jgi:hypothetical protein
MQSPAAPQDPLHRQQCDRRDAHGSCHRSRRSGSTDCGRIASSDETMRETSSARALPPVACATVVAGRPRSDAAREPRSRPPRRTSGRRCRARRRPVSRRRGCDEAGFHWTERRREASARRAFASKRKRTRFSARHGQRGSTVASATGPNARSWTSTSISMESRARRCLVTATGSGAGLASQRTA